TCRGYTKTECLAVRSRRAATGAFYSEVKVASAIHVQAGSGRVERLETRTDSGKCNRRHAAQIKRKARGNSRSIASKKMDRVEQVDREIKLISVSRVDADVHRAKIIGVSSGSVTAKPIGAIVRGEHEVSRGGD